MIKFYRIWKWIIALFLILTCSLFISCETVPIKNIQHSNEVAVGTTFKKIKTELSKGAKINLLLLFPESNFITDCTNPSSFETMERQSISLITSLSANVLKRFEENTNFTLVNRNIDNEILEEYKKNLSDLYDEENIVNMGNMVGANYIILIIYRSECSEPTKYERFITRELINIETNTIEALDEDSFRFTYNPMNKKWILNDHMLNGREIVFDEKTGFFYYL